MKIKEGDCFPAATLFSMSDKGPVLAKTPELFNDKKIVLVSVPGAFTPTCSEEHLPGYIKMKNDFFSIGVEKIYFVSVNDPFVMKEWGKKYNENDIEFLADSYGELIEKLGSEIDLTQAGLGRRLGRFAMYIENGLVQNIFDENGAGLDNSKAEIVLESIK